MLLVFGLTFLLQIIITQLGGAAFKTVPLGLETWIKIVLLSSTVLLASEAFKAKERVKPKRKIYNCIQQ